MNEKNKFNLYEEDDREASSPTAQTSGNLVSNTSILYVDLSKPLPEMIRPIREYLEDKPKGHEVGIYIIAGYEYNPDVSLFIDYLDSINDFFKFSIYVRGLIHSEYIHLLFSENLYLESGVKLVYRGALLNRLLKNLMIKPEMFRKFIQRFIDDYCNEKYKLIDVTELETLGFKFQKF